MNMDLRVNKD